jgi:hypothetical protein
MLSDLFSPNMLFLSCATPITVHGRLPTRMTLPTGSVPSGKSLRRVFWSITTTCDWCRTSLALKAAPLAI